MNILIVENDDRVAHALDKVLQRHGLGTTRVGYGWQVFAALPQADVVLLDLGLPDVDGLELCRAIRAASDVSIIVVAARDDVEDRIHSLRAGADDYLAKPYNVDELVARLHAVTRRGRREPAGVGTIRVGDVEINLVRQAVTVAGEPVALARKEFQLLALIASQAGAVCGRARLIAEIWGTPWPGVDDTLNVHMATLRAKLRRPGLIETVRGHGYRLAPSRTLGAVKRPGRPPKMLAI